MKTDGSVSVHPTGLFKTTKTTDNLWVFWHKALDDEEGEGERKYGFKLEKGDGEGFGFRIGRPWKQ